MPAACAAYRGGERVAGVAPGGGGAGRVAGAARARRARDSLRRQQAAAAQAAGGAGRAASRARRRSRRGGRGGGAAGRRVRRRRVGGAPRASRPAPAHSLQHHRHQQHVQPRHQAAVRLLRVLAIVRALSRRTHLGTSTSIDAAVHPPPYNNIRTSDGVVRRFHLAGGVNRRSRYK